METALGTTAVGQLSNTKAKEAGLDITHPGDNADTDLRSHHTQYGTAIAKQASRILSTQQLVFLYASNFQQHSLTGTVGIVATIVSGITNLPYSRILDMYGRSTGFAIMITLQAIGLIMMAACNNVATYAAGQVFYAVGYNGIIFTATVIIADTSALHSRVLLIGLTESSTIAMVWAAGPAAQSVLKDIGTRWGVGVWAIVAPVACMPLLLQLVLTERMIRKQDPSLRREKISLRKLSIEFDLPGLVMLAAGFSLLLLAFNLYSKQLHRWSSALLISFTVCGGVLILAFPAWEYFLAPKTFVAWSVYRERTIVLLLLVSVLYYTSESCWSTYFYSQLVVVFDQTVTTATYISNAYFVGAAVSVILFGFALTKYGYIKHYVLGASLPLTLLGTGLQIKFRGEGSDIGYVVMCQIFIAFGGGIMYVAGPIVLMAAVAPEYFPGAYAILGIVVQLGMAIGTTIATGIWTGTFREKLVKYLPASAQPKVELIYGSLRARTAYRPGTLERAAIDHAYGDVQRLTLIVGACLLVPCFVLVGFWRDYNVAKVQQARNKFLC